jgi:MFS family permease
MAIHYMGTSGAFYVNAASFLIVVAALIMMRRASRPARAARRFSSELSTGARYVYSQPVILSVLAMEATSSLFGLDNAMLTIFASDVLQVGAHGFGLLQSARGLGAVLGSGLFITVGQRPAQGKIVFASAFVYGLCFALFGLSVSFGLSLFLLACVGAGDAIWAAARSTIVQSIAPDRLRGRVMGIFQIANQGLNPLGQVETGLVVPLIGAREATFFGGSLVWVIAMIVTWRVREILSFRLDASIEAVGPRHSRQAP